MSSSETQKTPSQLATQEVFELAVRPQGIRQHEEYIIYQKHFGVEVDEETGYSKSKITSTQKSYIRRKVREFATSKETTALFVPDWVSLQAPRSSWNDMLEMTNNMYDRMQEYVNEYMWKHSLPSNARYAVEQQLFVLLVPGYSPRGIYDTTHTITQTVDGLESKKQTPSSSTKRTLPPEVSSVFEEMKNIAQCIL